MIKENNYKLHANLKDIRWWLLLYFIAHVLFIFRPPIEPTHAWRQSLTNMISRNLAEGDGNLFYPHIDYGGASQGIMASEFLVMQDLIATAYSWFGFNHWSGRLINLLVSCLGIMAFNLLVERFTNRKTALYATIALMFSIWLMFVRKSMPDTFSVSLVLMGLYLIISYLDGQSILKLASGLSLIGLGILAKIPALLLLTPLAVVLLNRDFTIKRRLLVAIGVGLALIPAYLWYYKWVPYLVALDNNPLFFPRRLTTGWLEIKQYSYDMWQQFTFRAFFSYTGFALSLGGVFYSAYRKNWDLLVWLMVTAVVAAIFILKTGLTFPIHSYYMVPIVPTMAFFAGILLANLNIKLLYVLLPLFLVESIANQHDEFLIHQDNMHLVDFESIADQYTAPEEPIVCNGGPNPQLIYFLNRKGWSLTQTELTADTLSKLHQNHHVNHLFHWNKFAPDTLSYEKAYKDSNLTVYKLP